VSDVCVCVWGKGVISHPLWGEGLDAPASTLKTVSDALQCTLKGKKCLE